MSSFNTYSKEDDKDNFEVEVDYMPKENESTNMTKYYKKIQSLWQNSGVFVGSIILIGLIVLYLINTSPAGLDEQSSTLNKLPTIKGANGIKVFPLSMDDNALNVLPPESFNYLVMIDAGSSGCRAHVYRYGKLGSIDGPVYVLPQHQSIKVKPGLSSFVNDTENAGKSLAGLVDFVKTQVPEKFWKKTPIWLKATAGLRLIDPSDADAILGSVKKYLSDAKNSPFFFRSSYAKVIPGNEEGAFGWIAFNYLMKIIGPRKSSSLVAPYAVIEMGGASLQVTQVAPTAEDAKKIPNEYKFVFSTESDTYTLYTHSYLGFGAEQARDKLSWYQTHGNTGDTIDDPCINKGFIREKNVKRTDRFQGADGKFRVSGSSDGEGSCYNSLNKLWKKSTNCDLPDDATYSFDCIYQPKFLQESANILVFENFYYIASGIDVQSPPNVGLVKSKFPLVTTPAEFDKVAKEVCGIEMQELNKLYPKDQQGKEFNIKWCFGVSYASAFLQEGLHIDKNKFITVQQTVGLAEIEWALGAAYKEAGDYYKRAYLRQDNKN